MNLLCSAGELNPDELERIVTILQNPTQYKIPTWFLNRQKDIVDGKNSQVRSSGIFAALAERSSSSFCTYADPFQRSRQQAPRGPRASEAYPRAQGYPSLLGCQGPWTAHEDHRPQGKGQFKLESTLVHRRADCMSRRLLVPLARRSRAACSINWELSMDRKSGVYLDPLVYLALPLFTLPQRDSCFSLIEHFVA